MEDNGDEKDASKRKNRNLSEKKRRDQFNILVNELSDLISNNNRKMDKSTILRSTISFLKIHNEVKVQSRAHDVQEDWKPAFLSNEEFIYLVLEALDGFIMVFSANGRIHYTSESITSLLGHNPAAIVNKNIYDMMHKDDQQHVINLLQRSAATNLMENQSTDYIIITFQVHIRRGCLDSKEEVYDVVQFYGHFRTHQEPDNERDCMEFRDVESRVLFVCIGSLCTPKLIRDVSSLVDSNRSEFTSRHSLEWKFLFLDHRAPPIIGYLPFEVLGTSGYDYYHFDDLEKVVTCHEALMEKGELTSCYYRFLTKGQQWIWLQTRYFITYHQWNSKPEFVVCTHRVVSYADVISAKDFVELDTEFNESAIAAKERLVKDPLPTLSPLYHISEANNDAFDNVYPSTSQDNITGLDIYQNHGKTSTTKPLFYISPRLYPQPLHPPFPSFQVPVFKVTDHFLVPPPLPLESVAPPFPESQVPVSQIEALQPLPPQSMSPQFPAFQFEAPQPLPPQSMSPQFPAFQVPEPPNLASDRPESTMSSLSVLEANYTGQFLDPPLQPASLKRASASSKIRDTIAQAAVPTSDTWHRAQVRYADGSDSSVSGESRTSQRTSDREAHIPPPTQPQPLQPLQTAKQECMVTPQHEMDAQYLELTTSPPRDQTQILEQLQRKHEELQQMIARQQEELRKVKEQLALARLGILQPLINVPESSHPTQEELQNQEPNNSAQSPLPQLAVPSIPTQPPQQPHSEHQQKPQ